MQNKNLNPNNVSILSLKKYYHRQTGAGSSKGYKNEVYGIEFEQEHTESVDIQSIPSFKTEFDNSLRGSYPYEFVLRSPKKHREVLKHSKKLFDKIKNTYTHSPRASTHIHINCCDLTYRNTMNLYALLILFENCLLSITEESRQENQFCLSTCKADHTLFSIISTINQKNSILTYFDHSSHRYTAINPFSLTSFGSIEVRAFESTCDINKVDLWLSILSEIYNSNLNFKTYTSLLKFITQKEQSMENVLKEISPSLYRECKKKKVDIEEKIFDTHFYVLKLLEALMNNTYHIPDYVYDLERPEERNRLTVEDSVNYLRTAARERNLTLNDLILAGFMREEDYDEIASIRSFYFEATRQQNNIRLLRNIKAFYNMTSNRNKVVKKLSERLIELILS